MDLNTNAIADSKTMESVKSKKESTPKILMLLRQIPLPWWALLILLIATAIASPYILIPGNIAHLIRQAVPGAMLALGETFVILVGGFDLSIGSLVSLIAALSSGIMAAKSSNILPAVVVCLAVGSTVGLVNGLIVTKLKVPSFLTTLGMMIILQGAALVYTGGMPKGGFPEIFRDFGLGRLFGIPYLVYIFVVIAFL